MVFVRFALYIITVLYVTFQFYVRDLDVMEIVYEKERGMDIV